ncbi:hypothetical protein [Falsirhodobacter algicola]|uniref:Uncharacterized protein n=1 Tax=Falsirhodobacter algicola TaxID=2692330 RepID=A0A8J8SLR3_9RHOB|nr:hypothetical protein [Falsirhodobacter algicola]QUS36747.1 hypothetical protein GR316_11030 [Falsirhodobacter algicola]
MLQKLFRRQTTPATPAALVVLGSSSSETFDYIFGDNEQYFPYWAGGWSARGLRKPEHEAYLNTIMADVPRDANILLNFGCADIAFTARHMAARKGVYDFARILDEAAEGIATCRRVLNRMGFRNVHAVFVSPMIPLPQTYWDRLDPIRQLPNRMMGRMYYDLFQRVAAMMPTIDAFDDLANVEDGSYLLKPRFKKQRQDHHADYVKIQHIVYRRLTAIPRMLPPRPQPFAREYPHARAPIKELIAAGTTRPRTCR